MCQNITISSEVILFVSLMYIVVVAKLLQYNVTNKHRYNVKVLLFVDFVIH